MYFQDKKMPPMRKIGFVEVDEFSNYLNSLEFPAVTPGRKIQEISLVLEFQDSWSQEKAIAFKSFRNPRIESFLDKVLPGWDFGKILKTGSGVGRKTGKSPYYCGNLATFVSDKAARFYIAGTVHKCKPGEVVQFLSKERHGFVPDASEKFILMAFSTNKTKQIIIQEEKANEN